MDHSRYSDCELLSLYKDGDIRGFNMLFQRHWKSLFSLANRILSDNDLSKDVLQEVFISFYQKAKLKEITNVRSYLLQCVKYQCFMVLRSGRISERHLDRLQQVTGTNYVEEHLNAEELEALLMQGMNSLPVKCREVFYLSRYELLSNKKIAEQLNISQKTVEHQITKALKTLRLSVDKLVVAAFLLTF